MPNRAVGPNFTGSSFLSHCDPMSNLLKSRKRAASPIPRGEHVDDADLVRRAIAVTSDPRKGKTGPIPAVVFATEVALSNPRTVRRYLSGDRPLPPLLREKCEAIIAADRAARKRKRGRT